ncbi:glycerophosphodiester phosphodiesterase [Staphylococcus gallinarum]|uniref:glycerophosphodiester phosphodiesterase n=1 Tax=Staphylococcus gallinarum TaxID=1293 RepID=UPI002442933B|nr:glycerophosphodiester phosphodiesterase family protein [Staphylococcus gallinarum]MEB7038422.1 glycerophosphodiester phosphodiesterase [Staphylococcus gallinarum]
MTDQKPRSLDDIKLIAHRGLSTQYPENTRVAFEAALESNEVDILEIDIHKTIDDQLVVIHDPSIDRTSNGTAKIKNNTLEELQQYDYGFWKEIKYANQKLLVLDDVLELIARSSKGLMIEVKQPQQYLDIENILINKLQQWNIDSDKISIQSFNKKFIKALAAKDVPYKLGVLINRKKHWYKKPRFKKISEYASFVNAHQSVVSKRFIHKAHRYDLNVYAYTVNDTYKAEKLLRYPLQGLVSDNPELL